MDGRLIERVRETERGSIERDANLERKGDETNERVTQVRVELGQIKAGQNHAEGRSPAPNAGEQPREESARAHA